MKRLVFVANNAWSMYRFRRHVLQFFLRNGYHVTVVAPADAYVAEIMALGCDFVSIRLSRKSVNPLQDLFLFFQLIWLYFKLKPCLVFHYTIKPNIWGAFAAYLLSIPSVAVVTGLGYVFIRENFLTKLVSMLYRFAFFGARQVWFLNCDDQKEFLRRKILEEPKTRVLKGEGIDFEEFTYSSEFPTTPTFLLIARMLWDKGVGEFVDAAKFVRLKYPHVRFQLLGPVDNENPAGVIRQNLDNWVCEGTVEYLGAVSDVRPYIRQSTAVVLPSYREGLPRVLLEAMAMGRPIIATDVPGCRELVSDGENGFLIKPRDSNSLGNAIVTILNLSEVELKKLSFNSFSLSQDYSSEKIEQMYQLSVLDDLR